MVAVAGLLTSPTRQRPQSNVDAGGVVTWAKHPRSAGQVWRARVSSQPGPLPLPPHTHLGATFFQSAAGEKLGQFPGFSQLVPVGLGHR